MNKYLDKLYRKLAKSFTKETADNLKSFKKDIEKVTLKKEEQVEKLVAEDFKQVKEEIAEYKAAQLKKIDGLVKEKVSEIAQKVLGQTISLTEHQRLIDEAIEKGIEEGMFRN